MPDGESQGQSIFRPNTTPAPLHSKVAGELLRIQHDFHALVIVEQITLQLAFKHIDRCAVSNVNTGAHSLLSVMHVTCYSSADISQRYYALPCLADKLFGVESGLIDTMSGLWD